MAEEKRGFGGSKERQVFPSKREKFPRSPLIVGKKCPNCIPKEGLKFLPRNCCVPIEDQGFEVRTLHKATIVGSGF